MPWFCWLIVGFFVGISSLLLLCFWASRKMQQFQQEEENEDIIVYGDADLLIYAEMGDQLQMTWDISQYETNRRIMCHVVGDKETFKMLPLEAQRAIQENPCNWTLIPHVTVWQQGGNFNWTQ